MVEKRDKLLKWLYSVLERYFLPLLLGAVVMNVIFNAYYRFYVESTTVAFVGYEALLFWFFEKIKKRKILRGFIYIFLGIVVLMASGWLVGTGWSSSGVSFIDWFYVNTQEVGVVQQYSIFLWLGLGFFIISILYYFTIYRFRIFGVMLVTMFPFVIYGKRSMTIDTMSVTFMMTIFLAMMVHQRLVTDESRSNGVNLMVNRSYTIAVALFVTFVGAVTMVTPKPEYESELEGNRGIFRFDINSNTTAYDDLNEVSSPRFGADSTGEILFYITTSEFVDSIYIRRQSFDYFRSEQWVLRDEFRQWYGTWEDDGDESEVNSPVFVYRMMLSLAQTGRYEHLGLTDDLFGHYGEYSVRPWINISGSSYSPNYIPAPLMASIEPLTYCYRNPHGEVYFVGGWSPRYGGIGSSYRYTAEGLSEYEYVSQLPFTWASFERIMTEAMTNGDVTPEQYSNILRIYNLYTERGGVSERIDALAHEITDGYDTDYEKCDALVDYFVENGYIYDLDYEPEDESIEYFLFDSKTGVCTSYATSMVLMARAVGIPARYVEGFVAYERNPEGAFVVRDSHAHAFVEAYLPGAGWVTFDPTVPDYRQRQGTGGGNAANAIRTFMDYFSRIALFLGVVFVLVFVIFLDRIIELFFRMRMKLRKSSADKTLALYRRILRLLEISADRSVHVRGMTPHEILELSEKRGAEVSRAIALFEQVCFGGYQPAEVEFEAAYSCYKQSWKQLAGKHKKKKQPAVQT